MYEEGKYQPPIIPDGQYQAEKRDGHGEVMGNVVFNIRGDDADLWFENKKINTITKRVHVERMMTLPIYGALIRLPKRKR
jgi:hypothetical protein